MAVTENTTKTGNVSITKRTGTEAAQVSPAAPEGTPTTVDVSETVVVTDVAILDPSSDDAVQLGEAGSLDLPINRLEDGLPDFSGS